jgi:ABC-type Fe3+-hydroxamate transport system substrate-binding protein
MLYIDQTGRKVEINDAPKRIVSLVPSQTELLYHLGLDQEVAGITKFCVHPHHWFQNKLRVGGTKQIHIEKIKALDPDLILANKEENLRDDIEKLSKEFPVWVSEVDNLESALSMIGSVGHIVNKSSEADILIHEISKRFLLLKKEEPLMNVCYLIWQDPFMTVGGDTFISNMLHHAGFQNIFSDHTRYPEITMEQLSTLPYDVLMLSSEPFPFSEKHIQLLQPIIHSKIIILVDGEMFSWYGSRMLNSPGYFNQLKQQVLSLKHAAGT